MNLAGAALSKQAAHSSVLVFGSMGPSGKMLMMEEVTETEMRTAFEEQSRALLNGGVDGIVVETMSELHEALLAIAAAKTTGLPIVACMVFDSGPELDHTMMGNSIEDCARELETAGADAIGANCGSGIEGFVPTCRRLRASTSLPIWIKPNAGLPKLVDGRPVYSTSAERFAEKAVELVNNGAAFIGGCCGTGPAFVRALAESLAHTNPTA
jgi:methionine synthase I (cobalamin-dependent)